MTKYAVIALGLLGLLAWFGSTLPGPGAVTVGILAGAAALLVALIWWAVHAFRKAL